MIDQIQTFFTDTPLGQGILSIFFAFAILIVGWVISALVARLVRGILKRFNIDNRVADALTEEEQEQKWPVEDVIGKITFWALMLFFIVAALEQLNLTAISQPLANFLDNLTTVYIPRLIGAGVLLLIAWLVAVALRFLTTKILHLLKVDNRLAEAGAIAEDEDINVTESLATAVFWFVFLLFLPSVLNTLGLQSLSNMLTGVFDTIIGWIPFVLMAALIAIVGWFLARIVRQLTISILTAFGVNRLGERAGISEERTLSEILGNILFYALLVVVLIAALDALQLTVISAPLTAMLTDIVEFIPGLLGAIVILIVSYFLGRIVANLVKDLLANIGFNVLPEKLGLSWSATTKPSDWVGSLTLVAIMLFAATYAAEVLGSQFLVTALGQFIAFLWQVFLAAVIFAIGLYFAKLAYNIVLSTGMDHANLLARLAQLAIIIFAGAIALQTLDVANSIVNLTFGITLAAAALAAALAFGLGSRDIAGREVDNFITDWRAEEED
jgi:hypothetical protein